MTPDQEEIVALRAENAKLKLENAELERQRNELLGDCHTYVEENGKLRSTAAQAYEKAAKIAEGEWSEDIAREPCRSTIAAAIRALKPS